MSLWLRVFLVSQWLLSVSLLSAQVSFIMPVINNVNTGAIVTPTVKVSGFDSIVGVQYVICWDPQVVQFQGLSNYNLPGLDSSRFSFLEVSKGILRFLWPSPNTTGGTSVPNGTTIFRLRMKVVGATGTGSGLKFMDKMPTSIEVLKPGPRNSAIEVPKSQILLTHGFVAVGYMVSDDEPETSEVPVSAFPNPFSESTELAFTLERAAKVRLNVTDVTGRNVYATKTSLPAGQHRLEIRREQLGSAGTYFASLQIGDKTVVRPIFLQ